ncbi:MAG: twin-arginine translocation signal domain-containing protein [Verrucomicrobia bacterium]|nr:twin-arginine translocation signal domain-containing protein [Verrucomicrobiota bacterium]
MNTRVRTLSRRHFLRTAGAATAGAGVVGLPTLIPGRVLAATGRPGANERFVVAHIGVGGMGDDPRGEHAAFSAPCCGAWTRTIRSRLRSKRPAAPQTAACGTTRSRCTLSTSSGIRIGRSNGASRATRSARPNSATSSGATKAIWSSNGKAGIARPIRRRSLFNCLPVARRCIARTSTRTST